MKKEQFFEEIKDITVELQNYEYEKLIIALLAYDRNINIENNNHIEKLSKIYDKWFDSNYSLLNDCFLDNEYDLLTNEEYHLLNNYNKEDEK